MELEKVTINEAGHTITYWRGYDAKGKMRYSADSGRTWASSVVAAFRAAMLRDAVRRALDGLNAKMRVVENIPGGRHLVGVGRKITGPFPGQYD